MFQIGINRQMSINKINNVQKFKIGLFIISIKVIINQKFTLLYQNHELFKFAKIRRIAWKVVFLPSFIFNNTTNKRVNETN